MPRPSDADVASQERDAINRLQWEIVASKTNPDDGRTLFTVRWSRKIREVVTTARYVGELSVDEQIRETESDVAVLIDSLSLPPESDETAVIAAIEARRPGIERGYALVQAPETAAAGHPLVGRSSNAR